MTDELPLDEVSFGKRAATLWRDETLRELLARAERRAVSAWMSGANVEVRERAWGVAQGIEAVRKEFVVAVERGAMLEQAQK